LKIIIPAVIIIFIIIFSIFFYEKSVYKPSDENKQTQVSLPTDSTKISENDSVIYADTNKTVEPIEEDIVFEDNGVLIKESEKGFYLQFGNYENQFELAKRIKELKAKKIYPSFDKDTTNGKQIYRLRLGPYKNLNEAKSIIPKL
jgi:cell division protein FtsN